MSVFVMESIFDEDFIRTNDDLAVWLYIQTHRDMAGFCPVGGASAAKECKVGRRKFEAILDHFAQCNKLYWGRFRKHIWWKSGAYHSMGKGKPSPSQLICLEKLFRIWGNSRDFGEIPPETDQKPSENLGKPAENHRFSVKTALQILAGQYGLVIPYRMNMNMNMNMNLKNDNESVLRGQEGLQPKPDRKEGNSITNSSSCRQIMDCLPADIRAGLAQRKDKS